MSNAFKASPRRACTAPPKSRSSTSDAHDRSVAGSNARTVTVIRITAFGAVPPSEPGPAYGHSLSLVIRRPTHARIEPLPPGEHDEEVRELLEGVVVPGAFASNIFGTLVRHRGLFRRWLPFGGKLLSGRIPARHRELAILRTAWLCR